MRILKVTFFIFLVVLLIGCLTFFEKEKIILPHIEMFIEGRGVPSTSQIEISPDGKLLVIYGGYMKTDWPTVNATML